jgi:hypothetical protein
VLAALRDQIGEDLAANAGTAEIVFDHVDPSFGEGRRPT